MPLDRIWPRLAAGVLVFLFCAGVAPSLYSGEPETIQDEAPPPFTHGRGSHLVRHAGRYGQSGIEWQLDRQVLGAAAVFADPYVPAHVLAATASGLVETRDHGRSWQVNAAASAGRIGPISNICFRLDAENRYYVGSKTRGLWQTTDGGKTFQQVASKASGLASDSVLAVYLYPADALYRTLLVIHGEDAPGLSKSADNGKTWQVLYPDYHILRLAFSRNAKQVIVVAASRQDPDVRNVYHLPSLQEPWQTLITDTLCTGSTEPVLARDAVYLSTSDKGLFKIARNGGVVRNIGPLNDQEWASLGSTWGATADSELIYGYDPKKLGMVLFTPEQLDAAPVGEDQPAPPPPAPPYTTQSRGLFTGPLVAEGAHIQANANGTVFYAVVNKSLYVGRRTASATLVREVSVAPAFREIRPEAVKDALRNVEQALDAFSSGSSVVQAARELQSRLQQPMETLGMQRFTVSATIACPEGRPPKSVTVDLSRLGLSPRSPLIEVRGRSAAAPGEGVYANTFSFDSVNYRSSQDWRASWTGIHGLTVSAVADDGSLAAAVGVLGIQQERAASVPFWTMYAPERESGDVTGGVMSNRRDVWFREPRQQISILKPGPWSVRIHGPRELLDLSGFHAVSFLLRADQDVADDLAVSLRDEPTYALPATSAPVFLMKEGFIRTGKITAKPQRVTIPVSRLIENSPDFRPSLTRWILFSGKASGPADIYINGLRCYSTADAVPTEEDEP
jgi:hypothetical protein